MFGSVKTLEPAYNCISCSASSGLRIVLSLAQACTGSLSRRQQARAYQEPLVDSHQGCEPWKSLVAKDTGRQGACCCAPQPTMRRPRASGAWPSTPSPRRAACRLLATSRCEAGDAGLLCGREGQARPASPTAPQGPAGAQHCAAGSRTLGLSALRGKCRPCSRAVCERWGRGRPSGRARVCVQRDTARAQLSDRPEPSRPLEKSHSWE